ncbi:MAG: hypothetical protein U0M12_00280 [Acutalibacteraceae bacterium]|nr:hypothetical protein [Acutalibacteraceae bacterium]
MAVSPILIIIVSAVLIATAFLYIINRPKKPIFTGVFLFLLLISVLFTFIINIELSSSSSMLNTGNDFVKAFTTFITFESEPSQQLLQNSFNVFCIVDIALIILTIIAFVLEMRVLFKTNTNNV